MSALRKFLPFLLLAGSLSSLASCGGNAAEESQQVVASDMSQFVLTKHDDGYYVDDYLGNDSAIRLPSHYQEPNGELVPVVAISNYGLARRPVLDTVYLSSTIKRIGANAFFESSLKKLYVTPTLEELDPEALNQSGIELIKKDDFAYLPTASSDNGYLVGFATSRTLADGVYTLTVPNGTKAIYKGVFNGFVGQLFLPDTLEAIGDGAFSNANFAYQGSFPNLRRIGAKAFFNSQILHFTKNGTANYTAHGYEFSFTTALTEIGEAAFYGAQYDRTYINYGKWSNGKIYMQHTGSLSGFSDGWYGNYEVYFDGE